MEQDFYGMIGQSRAMQEVYRRIEQAAMTDIPVLLLGETGTGKDMAACAIHAMSDRAAGAYIPVNLGALPRELIASELFGHEKGAFTGAAGMHQGKFEQARGGDVFLDEIDTIDESIQVALLRLIENKTFQRIGGTRFHTTDARVLVASNQDLEQAVREGKFRKDLYYRLDVFRIELPPLRERGEDIDVLVKAFLRQYAGAFHKKIVGVSREFLDLLHEYEWPGNVRELKNVIQRAVLVCSGRVLGPEHLPGRFVETKERPERMTLEVGMSLAEMEREMIHRTLEVTGNNRKRTAQMLGISRHALYNKLARYGLK